MNYKNFSKFGTRTASLMLGVASAGVVLTNGVDAMAAPGQHDILLNLDAANSSAIVVVDDTAPADAAVLGGTVSLQTDDPYCVASPAHPCNYTLNWVRIWYSSFTVNTTDGDFYSNDPYVVIQGPLAVTDTGSGIAIPVTHPVEAGANYSDSEGYISPGWQRDLYYQSAAANLLIDPVFQLFQINAWFNTSHEGHTGELIINASGVSPFKNLPPVAEAGPDVNLACGGNLTLDASASTDPEDNIQTYRWSVVGSEFPLVIRSAPAGKTITLPVSG
ncbi:MAG TPA: hypothetical protein VIV60_19045, partial [Polyangiaceae bacterium]